MKARLFIIAALAALAAAVTVDSSATNGPSCVPFKSLSGDSLAFKSGERLEYSIHYVWGVINADVAHAFFSIDSTRYNGEDVYKARVYGRTSKFFENFFKLREDFTSWISQKTMKPVHFTRDSREGDYHITNDFIYNWDAGVINATIFTKKRGTRVMELPLSDCLYDIPAAYYTLRNMDIDQLQVGGSYPITISIDDDNYPIALIYKGKETKKIRGIGTVRCLKFSIGVIAGNYFNGDEKIYAWFSDDENRILMAFECPMKLGYVSGHLEQYSGLAHEFSSKD
jgi:hypothetical protein